MGVEGKSPFPTLTNKPSSQFCKDNVKILLTGSDNQNHNHKTSFVVLMIQESVGCLYNNIEKQFPISTDNTLSIHCESYCVLKFLAVNSSHSQLKTVRGK